MVNYNVFDQKIHAVQGFPENLFQNVLLSSHRLEKLIAQPPISAVTLTGSQSAGRAVAAAAGKLLKKTVLELGGSGPYIVLADADLEKTVETCVASRLLNSGQSCIVAHQLQAGNCFVNAFVKSDPRLPFGGVKQSGYGRELCRNYIERVICGSGF